MEYYPALEKKENPVIAKTWKKQEVMLSEINQSHRQTSHDLGFMWHLY